MPRKKKEVAAVPEVKEEVKEVKEEIKEEVEAVKVRNRLTIDERIAKKQAQLDAAQAKCDSIQKDLNELIAKKNMVNKKSLLSALINSAKTEEEILAFLNPVETTSEE